MIKAIIVQLGYKFGRLLAEKAWSFLSKWMDRNEEHEEIDTHVEAVKNARRAAKKALEECEKTDKEKCRVPDEDEKRLREASRRLVDKLYGSGLR